ncbi:caspase family protein [Agromyces sp. ZXT2-3]|uniref:caspase family protein n=1 Tax=Agromyces sp. ZXT2-3 TaxID=3461152 RepID=UPI004054EC3A
MKLDFAVDAAAAQRTHALVIGVSKYPFLDGPDQTDFGAEFGMTELSSAASSAADVASWLISEYDSDAPLATLRILLSPADGETIGGTIAAHLASPCPATRSAVDEEMEGFVEDCRDPDAVAFVYVVGHGIQFTKRGAVLLLEDVARTRVQELRGALDVAGCFEAFDGPEFASTQFWFFDACRERLQSPNLETLAGAYALSIPSGYAASSTLYLGSSTREAAFSVPDDRSIFSRALLEAFRGAGADGPTDLTTDDWWVTTTKLLDAVRPAVRRLAAQYAAEQNVEVVGLSARTRIHRLKGVPQVPVRLTVDPEAAGGTSVLSLLFNATEPRVTDSATWPFESTMPAGYYKIKVTTQSPYHDFDKLHRLEPPGFDGSLRLGGA